jgi:heparin/heparan-sulfate lyase
MRSRWDDPDATWAFFGAGPQFAGHSRDDESHFLIANRGWLVLRAGGMGHNDNDYYAGGSLCYNIVSIFDPGETFRRVDAPDGGVDNERDGGLVRHVYGGSSAVRGHITAYKHDWRYTYAAADMTQGYRSTKVNEVTRQFLYIRGEHEYFIIYDRVDSRNAEFPKTWFLHIPTEPSINGDETELTAEHVYSYAGADYSSWVSDPAGVDQVLSTGKSRAHLTTLLPHEFTITKRGGEGHQFWGHPHEPTAQYNHAGSESDRAPVVNWRLEIESGNQVERDYFLNVLEITDEGVSEYAGVSLIEDGSEKTGVKIVPSDGGEPIEVWFSPEGEMSAEIMFGDEIEQLPSEVDTTIQLGSRGDFNGDGRLSVADILGILLHGRSDPQTPECDFNGDGSFTFTDVTDMVEYLLLRNRHPALAGLQ